MQLDSRSLRTQAAHGIGEERRRGIIGASLFGCIVMVQFVAWIGVVHP